MSDTEQKDTTDEVETTGHEWDGIRELNNPLPKWWLNVFYISIIWAVIYWVFMPAIPYYGPEGWTYTEGTRGLSQRNKVAAELEQVSAERAVYGVQIAQSTPAAIRENQSLFNIALASGASAFGDNCAGCHGSGAQGFEAFPNLNDDDWLWGGTLEDIEYTIRHGTRWEDDADTRFNVMPRYLTDQFLTRDQISDVTDYVLSLSQSDHDPEAAARGKPVFMAECVSCHGETGLGSTEMGAPNLADAIWLYGSDRESVHDTIAYARNGVMPAWQKRLDESTIKALALYVHSLGGGEE